MAEERGQYLKSLQKKTMAGKITYNYAELGH